MRVATGGKLGAVLVLLVAGSGSASTARPPEVRPRVIPVTGKDLLTAEWSPDGKRLACMGVDNTLYVLDSTTGKRLQTRRFRRTAGKVRWRPDWQRLAVPRPDGRIEVWDTSRWKVVRTLRLRAPRERAGKVEGLAWSPDGASLAVAKSGGDQPGSYDLETGKYHLRVSTRNQVHVWDVATGRQRCVLPHRRTVGPLQGHEYYRFDVAWRPDGKRLATCLNSSENWSSRLQIWDAATGRRVRELGGLPEGGPEAPAWRPDGKRLAAVWGGITVWDPTAGRVVRILANEEWPGAPKDWSPGALAWSPDDTYLAARNFNDYYGYATDNVAPIRIWNVASGKPVCLLRQPGAFLEGPVWSPDGTRLACAASDGTLRIWDLRFLTKNTRVR